MGLSTLNVWITEIDQPCKMSERTWYVTIFNCDGSVLRHCGKTYAVMPAPCGHWTGQVPPGTYVVKAVWGYRVLFGGVGYQANHFTDAGIVHICCDKPACVTLFNPKAHRCGAIYLKAVQDLGAQGIVAKQVVKDVATAVNKVRKHLDGQDTFGLSEEYLELEAARFAELEKDAEGG